MYPKKYYKIAHVDFWLLLLALTPSWSFPEIVMCRLILSFRRVKSFMEQSPIAGRVNAGFDHKYGYGH
jgi:hypothetical protein